MIHSTPVSTCLKALDAGRFTGLAWAFKATPDQQGDVILASALEAAARGLRVPLLQEHKGEPVGMVEAASVTGEGLEIAGAFDTANPAGVRAYSLAKSGEYSGLSIGFSGLAEQSGPIRVFTRVELAEVSVCRQPVNTGSRISSVKSWQDCETPAHLEKLLRSSGMPGRLAARVAAAAWPAIQKSEPEHPETDPATLAALRRFARL
jgi:HK97 family phage prohead protease